MKKFIFLSLFCPALFASAQDAHYTQFENSPFFVNPGSAGMLEQSDYRANLITKHQWHKMVRPAMSTLISADLPFLKYNTAGARKSFLGAGIYYGYSQLGATKTRQTLAGISLSGITTIGFQKYLGLGISVGKGGMRSTLNDATWDAQYDGYSYDASLPGNEQFTTGYKASFLDLSAGLNYVAVKKNTGATTNIGVSYLHGNNPQLKKDALLSGNVDPRMVFHLRTEIDLNIKNAYPVFLIPRVLVSHQGAHNEIQTGLSVFFVTGNISRITSHHHKQGIEGGLMYRYQDAVALMAGYKTESFRIGLSYDLTISAYGEAVKRRGGTEISFIYYGINKKMRETRVVY